MSRAPVTSVYTVEGLKDYKAYYPKAVAASATLAAILGEALQTNVRAVTIVNDSGNTIYYQADGTAASATNGCPIITGRIYTIHGDATSLANVRLYAASSSNVGFIQHID